MKAEITVLSGDGIGPEITEHALHILTAIGKKYGLITQIQYFRDRFESNSLGWLLFPILVIGP